MRAWFFKASSSVFVAVLLSVSTVFPVHAANEDTHVTVHETETGKKYTLNFQGVDLPVLVNTISQITGKNFVIDPRVKGKVTVVSATEYSADEVYDVFLSVLAVHNFVAIDNGEIVKVLPKAIARQTPTPILVDSSKSKGDKQITEVYHLRHSNVAQMVPLLKPLLDPSDHIGQHVESNSLIVTGNADSIKRLMAIIRELDKPKEGSQVEVVYLHYAKAPDLVGVLNKVLGTLVKENATGGGAPVSPGTVEADEATNSLIINGPADQIDTVRRVIDKLDIRRAQVFVEVLIAEVAKTKSADLGIEWQRLDQNLPKGQGSGSSDFDLGTSGLTLGYITRFVTRLNNDRVPDFQILLNALQADNDANIISTPNLLTLDNEEAEIRVAQEVPFVTGQYTTNTSTTTVTSTATTTNTGTTDTASAIVNPFQTIERKDVGLILKVKPQINKGDSLRLDISQELSSIEAQAVSGASDLITNKRSVKASVIVDNGKIIVIGGLITDDLQGTESSVPFLGKIPVLGLLFRKNSKKTVKRNLMVFLRPWIVRSESDMQAFTANKYGEVRDAEINIRPGKDYLLPEETSPVVPPLHTLQGTMKSMVPERLPQPPKPVHDVDECPESDILGIPCS